MTTTPTSTPTTTDVPTGGRSIDTPVLREKLASGSVRIIDVRTPAEYETAHIPGAYNVPLDLVREHRADLAAHLGQRRDEESEARADDVVLVCRSGARAAQAEKALGQTGLAGLRVLQGGMTGWEAAGGEVSRGRQVWDLERQVRLVAGSIVAASVLGSTQVPKLKWLAGAIGSGLTFAALSDTCAMGSALSRMPWNRGTTDPDVAEILSSLRQDAPRPQTP